jgi:TolB-like protein/predicted ATPase
VSEVLVTNSNISHYRIVSKIGAGGMGEVYLAEDARLGRKVALKLLPAEFTRDADRVRRFMQEAKAASALNHPNIITVYDIGESEAGRFIVMELVAGRTLRSVIGDDNSLETLLAFGSQMAKALSAAHGAGITHRDIKPDNIMVRDDGYVKVLDFGLARLLPTASGEDASTIAQQTTPGMIMGTVAYMSPEQASGQSASSASDIFAMGIVLYELVTGRHPFRAESLVGYLHAITLQTPPPPSRLRTGIPAVLDELILRMLRKDASQRPAAVDVAQALQEIERRGDTKLPYVESETVLPSTGHDGTTSADEGFWVAVLPFKWRGANADLEALAEGLTEDVVTGLSRFSYLRVIARSSTLRYASHSSDVRAIGKEVGARYVMEGNLRQAGPILRVAVQLVDAETGVHLWAESYDRPYSTEQLFALQDDLVPRIVSTCADHFGVLARSISDAVRWKDSGELSPYEALMRGFGYHHRLTPSEHAEAREVLEQAVERAPGNADCWAMLSWIYSHEYGHGFNPRPGSLDRALAAARRAVDLAPSNHLAYQTLAVALFFRREIAGCLSAAERAMALNPLDASNEAIFLITFTGEWERGCSLISRAMELNPHHPGWYRWVLALNEYRQANYREAVEIAVKANVPGIFWTNMLLAAAYGQLGELAAARDAVRSLLAQKQDFVEWARKTLGKWFDAELVERLMVGLRKAGLKIVDEERAVDVRPTPEMSGIDASPVEIEERPFAIQHTVGRKPERGELRAAFDAAKAGRGSLLCVAGEPGIGKTTLVEDFLAELATDEDATIGRGRCSERLAGTEAYLPLLDALEDFLQSDESIAPTMKQLAPTWYAQVVPLSGESDESARLLAEVKAASQERMKRELAAFLQAISQARPLVIFFDDLHWADISTIDVLSFLAGKFEALRLLIVVTYRPSDMLLAKHPFLQIKPDLQARGVCRELLLEFLNEAEIADYLTLEFPDHRFPAEFPRLIHAKTEGSPLFMADLVRYLRDRGVIAQASGSWLLAQAVPDIERDLPESMRGMIERKIAQLTEEDHKLLTIASVQGYEFDSAVVAQMLNLDVDEIEDRLEKLERVFAFVKLTSETEFPNRTMTMRYRFIHVLYQNALYTSLRATRRAKLSREVAQILEGFYADRTSSVANELAALYETGREFAKSAEYFQLAAEHSRRVFAEQEAAVLAGRGLAALRSLPDRPERAQQELTLQVTLGLALRTIKGFSSPETGKAYARARELCQQIGDTPHLFPVLFGLWEFDQSTAQLETAIELAQLLLAAAGEDEALRLVAHNVMADQLTWVGRFVDAREHLEQGIALYDSEKHSSNVFTYGYDSGVACLGFGSIVLWHLGYPDQALKMSDQARDLASKLPHPLNLAFAASFAAWYYSLAGSMKAAQEQADAAIAISDQYDIAMFLAWGKLMRGWALIGQGEIEDGIAISRQGIDEWRASGTLLATSWCLGILAQGERRAGRIEESLALLTEALDFASSAGEHFYEAELLRLRGEVLLTSDDGQGTLEAEQCFHQAIALARQQRAKSFELRAVMSLARLLQQRGKEAEARQILAEIYSWFTEGFDTTDLKDAKALLDQLRS